MITSTSSLIRISTRSFGRAALATLRVNGYASYALWKTSRDNEKDDAKASFFDAFESDASLRGNAVYSLSFAGDSLETDLASDDTYPLLDDIMMRQLLHAYSTHSLPSSSAAREMRNKLPPHLNLSNLQPFDLTVKDSLPNLEQEVQSVVTPSGFQSLPKTVGDIDPVRLDGETRAIVVTDIKSPFRITHVNTAWEALCGYTREECKGKSLGRLIQGPETDWSAVSTLLSQLFAGEEASVVLTNYAKNGRRFRNRITVGPVKDEMGKTVSFVGVLRELKESEEDVSGKYDRLRRETAKLPFVA